MAKSISLLKKHRKHYYSVFYSVNIKAIEAIRCDYLGVRWVKLFSKEFTALTSQIFHFDSIFKEELELFKHYGAHEMSCLFYAEKDENLIAFYNFLILLRPSGIREWLTFETYYSNDFVGKPKKYYHQIGTSSIWTTVHSLDRNYKEGDFFHLTKGDMQFVNKLLKRYLELSGRPFFEEFFGLYKRAYLEETDYFKYLLFFMIIESFIKDDETTGVVYKIRRLCAVFIGSSEEECELIYTKTNYAYAIRSKLVHSGVNEINDAQYLPYINSLVCEFGILILISDLTRENIFKLSTKLGYGQKKSLINHRVFKSYKHLFVNWVNFMMLEKKKKK